MCSADHLHSKHLPQGSHTSECQIFIEHYVGQQWCMECQGPTQRSDTGGLLMDRHGHWPCSRIQGWTPVTAI